MHVLFIPAWWPTKRDPTAGIFIKKQAQALANSGHEVGVIFFQNLIFEPLFVEKAGVFVEKQAGLQVVGRRGWWPFPKKNRWLIDLWAARFDSLFERYVAEFGRPDVLHAVGFQAVFVGERLSEKHGLPFVFTEQASIFRQNLVANWLKIELKKSWKNVGKVIAVSEGLRESMLEIWPGGEISVVPNLFLEADFPLPVFRKKEPDEPFIFLTVCALEWKKGLDVLISAFEILCRSGEKEARLVIVGDGKLAKSLAFLAKSSLFSAKIEFTGSLTGNALRAKYLEADAFVLASRHETFGTVVVEAMACGLPIVATRCGGPEHFLTKNEGLLVEPDDAAGLAAAMHSLLYGVKIFDRAAIRAAAVARFSEKPVAEKLVAIYSNAVRPPTDESVG